MKTLVLLGSGEFTDKMRQVDEHLLSISRNKTVVILPTAAGHEKDPDKWIADGVRHFKKLGADPLGIAAYTKTDLNKEEYIDILKRAGIVYFSGGHPGHLFKKLNGTKIWETIKKLYDNGEIILAGSSAGAMIMGKYNLENAQEVFEDRKETPRWSRGFALFDYSIIPHFDYVLKTWPKLFQSVMKEAPNHVKQAWIGIDENTALIVRDDLPKIMGEGRVHYFKN